jgi:DNA-binding transcriptional ArsR family regulator
MNFSLDFHRYFYKYRNIELAQTNGKKTIRRRGRSIRRYVSAMAQKPGCVFSGCSCSSSGWNDGRGYRNGAGIPGSTLSHHLEKLKNEGLLSVRRESTYLWYSANTEALQELLAFLYADVLHSNRAIPPETIVTLCNRKDHEHYNRRH